MLPDIGLQVSQSNLRLAFLSLFMPKKSRNGHSNADFQPLFTPIHDQNTGAC